MQTQREKRTLFLIGVGIAGSVFLYQWFLRPYREQFEAINYWLWIFLNHGVSLLLMVVLAVIFAKYYERWRKKSEAKNVE